VFDLAAMILMLIAIDQVTDTRAKREPFTDTMIDAERFQSFRTPKSAAWHKRQHEVAQGFLNRFMRQVRDPIHDDFPLLSHVTFTDDESRTSQRLARYHAASTFMQSDCHRRKEPFTWSCTCN
jgi:hypothetical protein